MKMKTNKYLPARVRKPVPDEFRENEIYWDRMLHTHCSGDSESSFYWNIRYRHIETGLVVESGAFCTPEEWVDIEERLLEQLYYEVSSYRYVLEAKESWEKESQSQEK